MSKKILIVDDHSIMREGLRALLEEVQDFKVIGEAENGRVALRMVQEFLPDVVIIDIAMPHLNGIEATRQIISKFPAVKVIMLSMQSGRQFVEEALKAGASGYLLKDNIFNELILALHTVTEGRIYLCPEIAKVVVKNLVHRLKNDVPSQINILTPREREVLQLLAEGKSTKQIARCLGVSIKTIETHRQQVMRKLDIYSIAELTKFAIREGITSL
ncbi:MAG: response regulator transcription factor [Candidatus Omnitrophota bacterium]